MAEMQWYAATDSGRFDGTAAITPRSGAVCLRAELPAGVLQNAVAALPWEMADDEKLFMNGYQTWTACPELGKWDRQHGVEHVPKFLLEKYSFCLLYTSNIFIIPFFVWSGKIETAQIFRCIVGISANRRIPRAVV